MGDMMTSMLSMVTSHRPLQPKAPRSQRREGPVPRGRRVRAVAVDVALTAGVAGIGVVLGLAWVFVRTGAGDSTPGDGDAAIGLALTLGAPAAWLAWTAMRAIERGATPGQRMLRLEVEASGRASLRRAARFALSPVGAIAWFWLGLVVALAAIPWIPLLLIATALIVGATGLASLAILLVRPASTALHDRIAGTTAVVAATR